MTELQRSIQASVRSEPAASGLFPRTDEVTGLDRAMDRYAEGDDAAFPEIFSALAPRLRAFLRRLSGSPELAEDLTQETLLKLHLARGSFARGRGAVPWAYAIARNCFMSHARSPKARMARASVDLTTVEVRGQVDHCAEQTTIAKQSAQVVERALAEMTPARREAFILLRYEGMSVAAAAQVLGTTEGAVKVRAFHAYEAIRAALEADGGIAREGPARNRHEPVKPA